MYQAEPLSGRINHAPNFSCHVVSPLPPPPPQRGLSGTFRNPQPLVFSQWYCRYKREAYCRYKWEAYCSTNWRRIAAFPFLESLEASKAQSYKCGEGGGATPRGVLRYKLKVCCSTFLDKLYALGVPKQCPESDLSNKVFESTSGSTVLV